MKYRKPVFQMRNLNNDSNNKKSKSNELWFDPLFDESTSFDTQWDKLSNLLEQ